MLFQRLLEAVVAHHIEDRCEGFLQCWSSLSRHFDQCRADVPGRVAGITAASLAAEDLTPTGPGGRERLLHSRIGSAIDQRSEEPTSELQSLMRISYAVFC